MATGLVAAVLLAGCQKTQKVAYDQETLQTGEGTEYLAHEVIVRKSPNVSVSQLESMLKKYGAEIVEKDSRMATQLGVYRVLLPSDVTADVVISQLTEAGATEGAERNYMVTTDATPNDPRYAEQWNMRVIHADQAWDITTGNPQVVVGVTDSGIDFQHPDLASRIWQNPLEIAGNGIDDDGNGYVDDVSGWDFVNRDNLPADDAGHGTGVSGVIGAAGNNGVGVAGLGWDIRIMPLKFIGPSGSGSLWDAAEALLYAADNNVKIVNASWGCSGCYSDYFVKVIERLGEKGGILVAAAGNDGKNIDKSPQYPAAYANDNIITVGASWKEDTPFKYSNWGPMNVDVVAPGRQILTTAKGGGYQEMSGTSLAAPHVAGILALYFALNPEMTPEQAKRRLMVTCDAVSDLKYKSGCEGRVNAYRMLTHDDVPPLAPENLVATGGGQNNALLSWDPVADSGLAMYTCKWGLAPGRYIGEIHVPANTTTTTIEGLDDGVPYYFVCYAVDKGGNTSPPSNEATILPKDETTPPQVLDLSARSLPGPRISGAVHSSSSEASTFYQAENAYDGSSVTAWLAAPSEADDLEYLEIDFNLPSVVERVALTPVAAYPEFFPVDFDIELSMDGSTWEVVGGLRNVLITDPSQKVEVFFPQQIAAHLRLSIRRSADHESGFLYTGIAELEAFAPADSPDTIVLTFTAPGDDPGNGRAASYDIRYSTAPITVENFFDADEISFASPAVAGVLETIVVDGLKPETNYWFAMMARDEVENESSMSNVAVGATATILPGTVTDLVVQYETGGATYLTWNAPGSDGYEGRAASYELRWLTTEINAATFVAAHPVLGLPAPLPAGSNERFEITSLQHGSQFLYFAIAAVDEKGHMGGISNVVSVKPIYDMNDTVAPAKIDNLQAFYSLKRALRRGKVIDSSSHFQSAYVADNLLDGDVLSMWMTEELPPTLPEWVTVDLGKVTSIDEFRLHPAVYGNLIPNFPRDFSIAVSADNQSWTQVMATDGQAAEMGKWLEWRLPIVSARYVKLNILLRGFASCNAPTDCNQPSQVVISELEIKGPTADLDVDLQWIAPGDDGWDGTAFAYDVRHATEVITPDNFMAATQMPVHQPQPAGMFEVRTLLDLDWGAEHYFALRTQDAAGNWSAISNVAHLTAAMNPPAPVTDLSASHIARHGVQLQWTAVGDDGMSGTADSYDVRVSKSPITLENLHLAKVLFNLPLPKTSGSVEVLDVSGLDAGSDYFFVVRVLDDEGGISLLSNMVHVKTLTETPPVTITDLQAIPADVSDATPLPLEIAAVSTTYAATAAAEMAVDGNENTGWLSGRKTQSEVEFIELQLAAPTLVGDLRLRPAVGYEDMFPADFTVQLKSGDEPFETVVSENSFYIDDANAGVEEWRIGGVMADRIRIEVLRTVPSSFGYFTAIGEIEVIEAPSKYDTIVLSWTAPSVTDGKDAATSYDVRHGVVPLNTDAVFHSAAALNGMGAPAAAGLPEFFEVNDLEPETKYCFGVEAADSVGNRSGISNSPCVFTPGVPPAPVVDLHITETQAHSATLQWTAPGEDWKKGTADRYELRVSPSRISRSNWDDAMVFSGVSAPLAAGSTQSVTVTGLAGDTEYHFALVTVDATGNRSGISNNARGTTGDDVAPLAITDLTGETNFDSWGSVRLAFTAPGDSGPIGQADRYDIRVSFAPITSANFESALTVTPVGLVPQMGGEKEAIVLTGLSPEREYFVAVKAADAEGNWSALSNGISVRSRDEKPGKIFDLEMVETTSYELGNAMVLLRWSAPGDDDMEGIANRYEFKYSFAPLTELTFETAEAATVALIPAPATTVQMTTITGLNEGVNYCFAMRAIDERDNVSAISNSVCTTTADGIAPAKIWDLKAVTGKTRGTVDLSWTHPGDDENYGKATSYELRWSVEPITADNFTAAAKTSTQPITGIAGTAAKFTATKLPDEVLLHFAIKAVDNVGNWSQPSNDAEARTPDVAPAAIDDLAQTAIGRNSISLGFTAVGDDERIGTATGYDLRYSLSPISTATFEAAMPWSMSAPKASGSAESVTISGLDESTTYYVAIRTVDDRGNWSPISNLVPTHTLDTIPPGQIDPLKVTKGVGAGTLRLDWKATGDDGAVGTATWYRIRYSSVCITEENWAEATPVANDMKPKASGNSELFQIEGLQGETTYYVGIRAVDEVGNVGLVSPCAFGETAAVAPGAITDLRGVAAKPRSVVLHWTAPFDVGTLGKAVSYDIRYATYKLTEGNFFASAQLAEAPVPDAAGTPQTATVPNLKESTLYYFAIKSTDDRGAISAISNIAEVTTLDETAPAAPPSIAAETTALFTGRLSLVSLQVSSQLVDIFGAENVLDGRLDSMWVSDASSVPIEEWAMADLGANYAIDRIRLLPSAEYMHLFPENFVIQVRAEDGDWSEVLRVTQFEATSATWMTFGFNSAVARYVRVKSYDPVKSYFGLYYTVLSGMEVHAAAHLSGHTTISWTAPGDDLMIGAATYHELFYSESPFDGDSLAATGLIVLPQGKDPKPAHTAMGVTISGLKGESRYYWAMRAVDEVSNIGPISAVVTAMSSDAQPAIVTDLRTGTPGKTSVDLQWTASGDDGYSGTAAAIEMRYATWPLTIESFPMAAVVGGMPAPLVAGASQSVTVNGLSADTLYYFAVVSIDDKGTSSYLSNVAVVRTAAAPDNKAPATITDLVAHVVSSAGYVLEGFAAEVSSEQAPEFVGDNLADGDLTTAWATTAQSGSAEQSVTIDLGAVYPLDELRIWPDAQLTHLFPPSVEVRVSVDGLQWTTVFAQSDIVASASASIDGVFPVTAARFVKVVAKELAKEDNGYYYGVIAEVEMVHAQSEPGTVVVTWTATGDDGVNGAAAAYHLRYSGCPFDDAAASAVVTYLPKGAGAAELARITGLSAGTWCIAVTAIDESANESALSNIVEITTVPIN